MKLELNLLRFLRAGRGVSTPEEQLRDDARQVTTPVPSSVELNEAFQTLENSGWAVWTRDSLTHQIRWAITTEGEMELAKRKL